ncbi:MAG: Gfo/Idh/MocA family oxidoreductase [Candidatus Hydrogenedentes bacterium]|nr:Gfo/Idh/MocA family oxidoreductase [Candidatus Hydrogenedentota bacterium]
MIGLDTSHVIAFTKLLNDPNADGHVPGGKVVAAYKGGSEDVESSYTRVDKYTEQLETEFGVKIVDTIEELCTLVDAVLLESVDGRPHLEQARPVFEAGKPIFIDKPIAGSLDDAIEIFRLAKEHDVPCFSSSSYRYYPSLVELKQVDVGEIRGAISYGPCSLEPHHPDLFWYGVHATEALFAVMGTGVKSVVRTATADTDVITGVWSDEEPKPRRFWRPWKKSEHVWADGRVGTLRGLRNAKTPHQVIIFGTKAVAAQEGSGDYAPLVVEIMKFFQTGVAPVSPQETIEMFAFMEAADESKRRGGVPVSIRDVLDLHSGGKPLPYE